jgi:hypothetical protein
MKKIDISTPTHPNTFALIDDTDYDLIKQYTWTPSRNGLTLYADTFGYIKKGCSGVKSSRTSMHKMVLGGTIGDGKEIDHIDGNGLNNTRLNLRVCSHRQNLQNRKISKRNTSGYKGVSWSSAANKWKASIKIGEKNTHIGLFTCLIKAAKAYDNAAKKHFGEYARLNFKDGVI